MEFVFFEAQVRDNLGAALPVADAAPLLHAAVTPTASWQQVTIPAGTLPPGGCLVRAQGGSVAVRVMAVPAGAPAPTGAVGYLVSVTEVLYLGLRAGFDLYHRAA